MWFTNVFFLLQVTYFLASNRERERERERERVLHWLWHNPAKSNAHVMSLNTKHCCSIKSHTLGMPIITVYLLGDACIL